MSLDFSPKKPLKRCRLTARAQIHGAVQQPGYVFWLEEGERGPHRTVVASDHGAETGGDVPGRHVGRNITGVEGEKLVDHPLYEEFPEEPVAAARPTPGSAAA